MDNNTESPRVLSDISVLPTCIRGKVVKQVPSLDLCQEQAKDQELNSAGTELKIRFVIVTMIEISYGSNQNAKFHIKNLCPHIQKIAPQPPVMIQIMA